MGTRLSGSHVMITAGLVLLLTALFIGLASVGPAAAQTGVTPTGESPVETPTEEPTLTPTEEPTLTPTEEPTLTPTEEPTEEPTKKPKPPATQPPQPQPQPTVPPAPTPVRRVFRPIPSTGGGWLSLPIGTVLAGLGAILIGLGLAWRRRR
ncbi:MAG: hypothetical protein PVG25_06350 [Anaerolineae bacterium]